jgi:putative selenate reductase molybdopterin-binding subunit
VLPAVFDENEAIKEGAPVIHDEPEMEGAGAYDPQHNISHYIEAEVGDVAQGFAEAAHVFENDYYVHQVQQAPIEPHIAISYWDPDERLVIRTSTQVPFHVRRMVAPLLDLPVRRIRVIKPRIGGGFGVKQEMLIEDIVGHLTIKTGRPVRLELTREEEFVSSRTRHPQTIKFKSGVAADGTLVAQKMTVLGNTGPYATHGLTVQTVTGLRGLSTYNCPNKRFECKVVYTNIPVPGAYRGYGAPQALFALEVHMEEIAEALDMDVIEFKAKNWVQVGDPLNIAPYLGEGEAENVTEIPVILSSGLDECIAQGMQAIGWQRRHDAAWHRVPGQPHLRRGLGMAVCMHGTAIPGLDMGGASIKINDDGSFNVLVGATDLGTGSDTVLSQIAAEVLGVPLADILIYSSDTDMTPFDTGAYASSTTYISGRPNAGPGRLERRRVARAAGGRAGWPQPHPAGDRPTLTAPGGSAADNGHGLFRQPRVAAPVCGPVRRGGGGRGNRPGHGQEAGDGRRLRRGHQPDYGQRSGRRGHDPGAGLRALRRNGL